MSEHSLIGASSAHRWFECPGCVRLAEEAPPQIDNKYAKQGTAAHWVLDQCVSSMFRTTPWDFLEKEAPNGHVLLEEDIEAVEEAIGYIKDECAGDRFKVLSEVKFELDRLFPNLFGTSDIVLINEDLSVLKVIDYKHGKGIPVEVDKNKQLLYYGLGAINYVCKQQKADYVDVFGWGGVFKEIHLIIIQPRCHHVDGPKRTYKPTPNDLDDFVVDLVEAATRTDKPDAELKAGDHCRFCPALAICPAFNQKTMEVAQTDFRAVSSPDNLNMPQVESLKPAELAKIMRFTPIIKDWLDQIHAQSLHLVDKGTDVPGFKLVKKRANRKWKDDTEAEMTLSMFVEEEELFTPKKLKSPAQVEKLLKKNKTIIEDLVVKPDNGNTIVPEHDKRQAVKSSALTDFQAKN